MKQPFLPRPFGPAKRLIDRFRGELDPLLASLFDADRTGRLVLDGDGRIVRVNTALAAMIGNNVDLTPGAPAAGLFDKEKRAQVWNVLFPVLVDEEAPRSFLAMLAGDGVPMAEILPTKLIEADGDVSGLILQFTDTTVNRLLETQLAQSQKMQAVGQLAAGIAHDFNNLLTAVRGAADDIAGREGTDAATLEDAMLIRGSAERGAGLVRQLLAFSRQQTLQPRVVAVNQAVTEVSTLLHRGLGAKIKLELDLEDPGRSVKVDPVQLDQMLVNLSVNARDAMPEGGILTIRTGHQTLLRPSLRGQETIPPGRYVVIELRDTGTGIPADLLPRIFDPFFTTKRDHGGTGLGLSTVHGIARQSDGFLTVESEVGKGSTFSIYLPRHEGALTPAIAVAPPGPGASPQDCKDRARTVLIVEDDDDVRRLAVRQFGKRGWSVLEADCGDAAREMLFDAPDQVLDIVVSDVVMPGLDGLALVRLLRGLRPALPAILVSGYADERLRRDLARENVAFMPKPYSLAALIDAADQAISP